jgi:hypothetical protein
MRKLAPLALSALAVLALAGCAGGSGEPGAAGGDSSQSVADACAIAEAKLTEAQAGLNDSLSSVASGDYSGLETIITGFQAGFDEALSEISNEEVGTVLQQIADDYDKVGAALTQLSEVGTDPEKIDELTALSDEMTEVGTRIQDSGAELTELCG